MLTTLDTARKVPVAILSPGDRFRLNDGEITEYVLLDPDSPFLSPCPGCAYSCYRGRIVEHDLTDTVLITVLDP